MDDLALDYFQDSQVLIPPAPEVNSTTLEASIDGLVPIYSKSNAYSSRVVSSTRTTACDIMCTANTSRPYKVPVPTTLKKKKATAHLPYKPKDLTVGGFDGDGTTLEQLKSVDSKEKRNMQFITEKYRFLTALYENRDLETADENVAATIIQARYRGYRIRKRLKGRASFTIDASPSSVSYTKATATKKIWKEPVTLMMLQVELIQMAEGLGLNPIVGLNIHGLLKKNAKQRRLERRAAQCIRNLFMKTLVVSRARAVVNQKREQKRHRAALRIQKFFRFVMAKKLLSVDQDRERSMQIVRVQRLARGFIARVRARRFRMERVILSRMEEAAVKLQRSLRLKAQRDETAKRWESATGEGDSHDCSVPHGNDNYANKKPTVLVGAAAGVINAISRGPSSVVSHSSST